MKSFLRKHKREHFHVFTNQFLILISHESLCRNLHWTVSAIESLQKTFSSVETTRTVFHFTQTDYVVINLTRNCVELNNEISQQICQPIQPPAKLSRYSCFNSPEPKPHETILSPLLMPFYVYVLALWGYQQHSRQIAYWHPNYHAFYFLTSWSGEQHVTPGCTVPE